MNIKPTISIRSINISLMLIASVTLIFGIFLFGTSLTKSLKTEQLWIFAETIASSSRNQTALLLPGLLVKERAEGNSHLLSELKNSEDLISCSFGEQYPIVVNFICKSFRNKNRECIDLRSNTVTISVPIIYDERVLGFLNKTAKMQTTIDAFDLTKPLLEFLFLYSVVFLAIVGIIILILEKSIRLPLIKMQEATYLTDDMLNRGATILPQAAIVDINILAENILRLSNRVERVRSDLEIGRLAAQVAHDIRSPLTALDFALTETSSLDEMSRVIVKAATQRIHDIANQLLSKTRSSFPSNFNYAEPVLISSLIESIVSEKRVEYRLQISTQLEWVCDLSSYGSFSICNPIELKSILSNLINNSFESLERRRIITVGLKSYIDTVEIYVKDSGKGIPAQILKYLGEKKLSYGKSGKNSGMGIALFNAKRILGDWNGSLKIESHLGQGTNVTVRLQKSDSPKWFLPSLQILEGWTVVVLDDDQAIHTIWESRLIPLGIRVKHFSTVDLFRSYLSQENNPVNLFLIGYRLIEQPINGLEIIEELGLQERSVKVTSNFEDDFLRERCIDLGLKIIPKGLAHLVPINRIQDSKPDAILVDDDLLIHESWKLAARRQNKRLVTFQSVDELKKGISVFHSSVPLFLDFNISPEEKGDVAAKFLYDLGFINIYITTGCASEEVPKLDWIKGIVGKNPPSEWVGG